MILTRNFNKTSILSPYLSTFNLPWRSHGRRAGYPAHPNQIPACGTTAPGSSGILASVIGYVLQAHNSLAIFCSEVCTIYPVLHVQQVFPLQTTYTCQPLPEDEFKIEIDLIPDQDVIPNSPIEQQINEFGIIVYEQ